MHSYLLIHHILMQIKINFMNIFSLKMITIGFLIVC